MGYPITRGDIVVMYEDKGTGKCSVMKSIMTYNEIMKHPDIEKVSNKGVIDANKVHFNKELDVRDSIAEYINSAFRINIIEKVYKY